MALVIDEGLMSERVVHTASLSERCEVLLINDIVVRENRQRERVTCMSRIYDLNSCKAGQVVAWSLSPGTFFSDSSLYIFYSRYSSNANNVPVAVFFCSKGRNTFWFNTALLVS